MGDPSFMSGRLKIYVSRLIKVTEIMFLTVVGRNWDGCGDLEELPSALRMAMGDIEDWHTKVEGSGSGSV